MPFDPINERYMLFEVIENRPEMVVLILANISYDRDATKQFKAGLYRPLRKRGITTFVNETAGLTFIVPFNQTLDDARAQIRHYLHKHVIIKLRK